MERPRRRKLLVASVGIASVSYALAACGKSKNPVSGNLAVYVPVDAGVVASGNDAAPEPPKTDASK